MPIKLFSGNRDFDRFCPGISIGIRYDDADLHHITGVSAHLEAEASALFLSRDEIICVELGIGDSDAPLVFGNQSDCQAPQFRRTEAIIGGYTL